MNDELEQMFARDAAEELPPWLSRGIREAQSLGDAAVPLLVSLVDRESASAFLALEALRRIDPATYERLDVEQRARIYAWQLASNASFNTWGTAGDTLSDTAHAFAALGAAAVAALRPLLDDRRPALLEGSEEAMMSEDQQYRVRDYAWLIASEALGRAAAWSPDPAARDREIDAFGRSL